MDFKISDSPVFTTLTLFLTKGESFRAEAGAMISMSSTIEIQAKTSGKGILGTLKAAVGGESLFATLYTATTGDGEIVLAPPSPGEIKEYNLNGNTLLAQSGAYLAGSPELDLSTQGSLRALISGEGLFLSKISGTGKVFISAYGSIFEKQLKAGETYIVDTGHIVAFEEQVTYRLKKSAQGLFSTFASGEGLVCEYSGPGRIWIQSRNLSGFAGLIARFLPKK